MSDHDQYPTTWDDFVGQDTVTDQLRIASLSAAQRGVPLSHVLLSSPIPGIGKTAIAHLIARTMQSELHVISGKVDGHAARIMFAKMDDSDVLLIDELHRVFTTSKKEGEWLLHVLQDGSIIGPTGPESIPAITVVGTTTDVARIPETVVSRFAHRPHLEPYSQDEAEAIARKMIHKIFADAPDLPLPHQHNITAIARAGDRNPRVMRQIIKNLLDVAWVDLNNVYDYDDGYDLSKPLLWLGLSPDGLEASAVKYLSTLLEKFGGVAGEKIMADALREPAGVRHIERVLLDRDFIRLTPKGRTLTTAGIRRAHGDPASEKATA